MKRYRDNVGMMIFNRQGRIFLAKRLDAKDEKGWWQMPQGGIKAGEDPAVAVMREMKEEIGTNDVTLVKRSKQKHRYDFPEEVRKRLKGGYYGQEQTWFLFFFKGDEGAIDLAAEDAEFQAFSFVKLDEIIDLCTPFKVEVYKKVIAEFTPAITRWLKDN